MSGESPSPGFGWGSVALVTRPMDPLPYYSVSASLGLNSIPAAAAAASLIACGTCPRRSPAAAGRTPHPDRGQPALPITAPWCWRSPALRELRSRAFTLLTAIHHRSGRDVPALTPADHPTRMSTALIRSAWMSRIIRLGAGRVFVGRAPPSATGRSHGPGWPRLPLPKAQALRFFRIFRYNDPVEVTLPGGATSDGSKGRDGTAAA